MLGGTCGGKEAAFANLPFFSRPILLACIPDSSLLVLPYHLT